MEVVPKLESLEVALVHCNHYNLVNINYQQASKVLSTFVYQINNLVNNLLLHLIHQQCWTEQKHNFHPLSIIHCQVWFTGQNSKQLEIEDNVNVTLIVG